jgi:hypothetical protein
MEQAAAVKEETKEPIPRNTDKKRIEKLEVDVAELSIKLELLTNAIIQSAHVIGWPKDLLIKHGLKPFDKKTDTLRVNGRA